VTDIPNLEFLGRAIFSFAFHLGRWFAVFSSLGDHPRVPSGERSQAATVHRQQIFSASASGSLL
jgi:hypothetical protein